MAREPYIHEYLHMILEELKSINKKLDNNTEQKPKNNATDKPASKKAKINPAQ